MSLTNKQGETPLHIACKNGEPLKVILKMLDNESIAVKTKDQDGCLPLHHACMNGQSIGVIEALIEAYPVGLGVRNNVGKSPFGWDYGETPGGFFSKFINSVVESRGYEDINKKPTAIDRRNQISRLLGHCKNYVPLDILKLGYLSKKNLESKEFVRWLNEMPCRKSVVFFVVLEFYLHIVWIATFVSTSYMYFEFPDQALDWRPTALIVFAAIFLLQEIYQVSRFYKTNALLAYWLDLWNWVDLTSGMLMISSAVKFLHDDRSENTTRIIMATGCFQSLLFLSYLKKTFFPFSKFVNGVIKIVWAVVPFLVVSFVTLFTFSFMYFIQYQHNHNISILEAEPSHATMLSSFQTVLMGFTGDTTTYESVLDYLYGIIVVIILLNVIIAVVSEEWEDAVAEANAAFWNYRLDLILEKTRGIDIDYSNPAYQRLRKFRRNLGRDLDNLFLNSDTVGTTTEEMKKKLALAYTENDSIFCIKLILKSVVLILLGFPTCGMLWPKFFRQMLFTPPTPRDDPGLLAEDIGRETKRMATDDSGISAAGSEEEILERDIAEYRREVRELSQQLNAQNALLEQLLTKISSKED
mmetsp:Transcript_6925/g.11560  ORF Transcript_6925/g.11560 Transcript_6925/m.11560 type:complete len:583 (+) Transcript_6925:330-2078(+)